MQRRALEDKKGKKEAIGVEKRQEEKEGTDRKRRLEGGGGGGGQREWKRLIVL